MKIDKIFNSQKIKRKLHWFGLETSRSVNLAMSKINGRCIVPGYWNYSNNFGEWITHLLLKQYKIQLQFTKPLNAKITAVGSVLDKLPEQYPGIIWGTGFIHASTNKCFPKANIVALRGRLTASKLNINNTTLGDPGLLAPWVLSDKVHKKKWVLGIVPHYHDKRSVYYSKKIYDLKKRLGRKIKIINVQNDALSVIKNISKCENIISSSLHGLITADSLGIPNAWVKLSELIGGDFKFKDYYSVFDLNILPITNFSGKETLDEILSMVSIRDKDKVSQIQTELLKSLTSVVSLIK